MAFRLSRSGLLSDDPPREERRRSFLGSAVGAVGTLKDKASAAASAASAAAGAAAKSAKKGMGAAKGALSSSSGASPSAGSFRPPPRGDEDLDLQRALEASLNPCVAQERPAAAASSGCDADGPHLAAQMQQLQNMGFSPEIARVALLQSGGDVPAALALLCGDDMFPAEEAEAPKHSAGQKRMDGGRASVISEASTTTALTQETPAWRSSEPRDESPKPAAKNSYVRIEGRRSSVTSTLSIQSQAMDAYQAAKASLMNVKRRAEALFDAPTLPPDAGETFNLRVPTGCALPPGESLQRRQAALEAAERRLAEARARNAGTMDDWRRYRQFRMQQEREEQQESPSLRRRTAKAAAKKEEAQVAEDEEEDLQRALAVSMSQLLEEKPPEGLEEKDPELFELRLKQAIAEEELGLQRALAASLGAEREAIEALGASCSGPAVGEEAEQDLERERLSVSATLLLSGKTQECLEREKRLEEENQALQERLGSLREALLEREKDRSQETTPAGSAFGSWAEVEAGSPKQDTPKVEAHSEEVAEELKKEKEET